jgi:tRNA-2-methylthio-N6-dimethylallyladenosine synthase
MFPPRTDADSADLVVLNTCHIREKAAEKVYSDIGRVRKSARLADRASTPTIAVAGCVAQAEGAEIANRAPTVDVVVGPQAYHNLARPRSRSASAQRRKARSTLDMPARSPNSARSRSARRKSAPDGVPDGAGRVRQILHLLRRPLYARRRGQPALRRPDRRGAQSRWSTGGAREITLLGQNVNAWDGDAEGRAIGLRRPDRARWHKDRWAGPHPLHHQPPERHDRRADRARMREVDKLMPFLHLPVQAGSDRILESDEPQPQPSIQLSARPRPRPRRTARHRAVGRLHRRLSRRERRPSSSDTLEPGATRSATPSGVQLQILAPPRHARRRTMDGADATRR